MTVDIHAHVVPQEFITAVAREVPQATPQVTGSGDEWFLTYPSGRRSGPMPPGMFDTGRRLADMDRQGVAVQALSVPPMHFLYGLPDEVAGTAARLHNDAMIAMAQSQPDRFQVLATLPLQSAEAAIAELERVARAPGVVGVELGTNLNGLLLDHPSLTEVWSALDRSGMCVVLHPDNVAGADRMQGHYLHNFVGNPSDTTLAAGALIFGGVLTRNGTVRVALLHGGGFLPYQIGRFDHGWRVRPEARDLPVAPSSLLERFYFDTLTHDPAALAFLLQRVGPQRLCLGSDYPFDMADPDPVGTVRATLQEPALQAVLEDTPRALLTRAQ